MAPPSSTAAATRGSPGTSQSQQNHEAQEHLMKLVRAVQDKEAQTVLAKKQAVVDAAQPLCDEHEKNVKKAVGDYQKKIKQKCKEHKIEEQKTVKQINDTCSELQGVLKSLTTARKKLVKSSQVNLKNHHKQIQDGMDKLALLQAEEVKAVDSISTMFWDNEEVEEAEDST